jgi:hypothetical protein
VKRVDGLSFYIPFSISFSSANNRLCVVVPEKRGAKRRRQLAVVRSLVWLLPLSLFYYFILDAGCM